MSTNANEPEQEPTAQPPAARRNDSSTGEGEGAEPQMVQLPAELLANLPPEFLENLPPEIQANLRRGPGEVVTQTFTASMSMMLGSMVNPIAAHITPQHIADVISITGRELDHDYRDRKHSRLVWVFFAAFAIAVLLALSITLTLSGMGDLLLDIFKGIAIFAGGFGGGYGVSTLRRR